MSNNRIQFIPPSIGLLVDMKIFLADVNALTRLPGSLGQCRGLRILNVSSNNLLSLPDEIGDLVELRVLNLANNYLRHLPSSISRLTNLKALWLSGNQKKPLVVLEADQDEKSKSQVLTCFLLPQTGPIFGPVSPTVAAAVMKATSTCPPTNPNLSSFSHKDESRSSMGQLYATGSPQQQMVRCSQKQQPHNRLLDEEEEAESDLLQMSNILDKSFAAVDGSALVRVAAAVAHNRPLSGKQEAPSSSEQPAQAIVMHEHYLRH